MEEVDFVSNGIVEIKDASGEVQELRFQVGLLSLMGKVLKNIFLFILIFIAIIFSFFTLYSIPFFLVIILLVINKRTIVVTKDHFISKNSIPIFPSKKISILDLERLAVKRVENKYPNRSSSSKSVTFELYAIFKNKPAKLIFKTMIPILAGQMDRKIEKLLNIKDISNSGQFEKISKTHYQNKLEAEYSQTIQNKKQDNSTRTEVSKNLNIDKPSKSFPFTVSTKQINLKIVQYFNYSGKSGGIKMLVGLVFTFIGIYLPLYENQDNPFIIVCSIIGFPIFVSGISGIFNKRFINVSKNKINYFTKPISLRKEKEILKSKIKNIEVCYSGQQTNGVPSYNIVIEKTDGKTDQLIKHVFNELALKDLANEIRIHMDLNT